MSLHAYAPYLIFGVTDGSVYGLAAMGLVLSYKTSGVFNVGYGGISAASAYCFYSLNQSAGLAWGWAALLTVGVFGPLVGLGMEQLARGLARVPSSSRVVATVGLLISVIALATIVYGTQPETQPIFLPNGQAFRVSGVSVTYAQVITLLLGVAAAAGLYLFFQRSRTGRSMRAVVDDSALLDMTGESPARIRRLAWVIGCMFAAAAGPLLATKLNVDAVLLSLLVIQAFGAASIGLFTSLPLAFGGGIVVGVLQDLTSKEIAPHQSLQGLDLNIPFFVLLIVLIAAPKRKLTEVGRAVKARPPAAPFLDRRQSAGVTAAVMVLLALVPFLVGTKLTFWNTALPFALVFMSLGLLVRVSGQVSLCQVGLMAVGAAALGHLLHHGVPWLVAMLVAGLIAVPVGAVVAVPAIRLSGLYLGLATLGVGVLLSQLFYSKGFMFGTAGLQTPRPHVFGFQTDRGYWYFELIVVGLGALLIVAIEKSRMGRLLRGMADAPTALVTAGLSLNVLKVIVFCVAAFLAGIGGALFAANTPTTSGQNYSYVASLVLIAVMTIAYAFRRTVPAALAAAIAYEVVPGYVNNADFANYLQLGFGICALAAALLSGETSLRFRVGVTGVRSRPGPTRVRLAGARKDKPRLAGAA